MDTTTKLVAIVAGVLLLGVGQAEALERSWIAKAAGIGLLGFGIYQIVAPPPTPEPATP